MNSDGWQILIGILICLVFIGFIILMVYSEVKEDNELCGDICSRKGTKSLGFTSDGWDRNQQCKCLTDGGDIKYYPAN